MKYQFQTGKLKEKPNFYSVQWLKKIKKVLIIGSNSFSAGSYINFLLMKSSKYLQLAGPN